VYHFLGSDGPYAGVEIQEGMGSYFRFGMGVRAGWDWSPSPSLPITVAPDARIGFATSDGNAGFNLRVGVEAKYTLPMGLSLHLRPLAFNFAFGDVTITSYDLLAGAGFAF
jgi:hypothetical protein